MCACPGHEQVPRPPIRSGRTTKLQVSPAGRAEVYDREPRQVTGYRGARTRDRGSIGRRKSCMSPGCGYLAYAASTALDR